MLLLCLFGLVLGMVQVFRRGAFRRNRVLVLLLFTTLTLFLSVSLSLPLPFQRYYLILVPFSCLWIAYGLDQVARPVYIRLRSGIKTGISSLKPSGETK
jgi:hypothetical protein